MKNLTLFIALSLSSEDALVGGTLNCHKLAATSFGSDVKIDSAVLVAAAEPSPEYCDVRGSRWPETKFAIKLPTRWNNRFYMAGNGGTGGTISFEAMEPALRRGFATASTDTGHDAVKEPLASFAYPVPNNPYAKRKLVEFAYGAVHETVLLAKRAIKAYYGERPRYSYWDGVSGGGRQGLIEAQRFPSDFDGFIVGAPILNLTGTNMRHIWNAQTALAGPGAISNGKLRLLANAVYKKCDGVDGLEDGLIDDPRNCMFDPGRDLPTCPGDTEGLDCFTGAQMESLKRIYGGVRDSAGKLLFPGQPPGAEAFAPSGRNGEPRSGWEGVFGESAKPFVVRSESYMRVFLDPPPNPEWNYQMFNFDAGPGRMARVAALVNATNPDMRRLKQRAGKIIHYHGWADPPANPLMSIDYYESVLRVMGDQGTKDFYRLFMVPGMFHILNSTSGTGIGYGTVDWLSPIVEWVENGKPPDSLIGARLEGSVTKTRPLCPYPKVAKYNGSGSIDVAENFSCVMPY
jgi:hypothetical protein